MEKNEIAHIDLEKILEAKLPNRKLPKFIIRYLKKIVHVDEINHIFRTYPGAKNFDFIESLLDYMNITYSVEGLENLPKGEKYIFAGNHPLGGLDGVVLAYVIGKEYDGKVRLLTNDILLFLDPLKELFIPVNKVGAQGKENVEKLNEFYNSDDNLITFPSGKCSRKAKGKIIDPEWKKNFIAKATRYHRDVVPIYFEGRNSNFFYNLANLRTFFGVKLNLEMLYLADELFKQKGSHFTIKIGNAISWEAFGKSKSQLQWADWVKGLVYEMK
ncbi:glycerol acyltransferase [Paludibacter sp. 221]|uniref:1-acyl-sn-glycerol-3-phosphate acyltransferase n=1 Tax=Paludibacter sp. 221 TaxID=2302939 RepID=UPI0013CF50F0|nr:1-acyl-sn-glycerol-3-phosphate acyltransferase [Paludibacter sp. 221]NDV47577.1 glycerol acyltransferase [Paludibacter sp. 221]